MPPRTIESVGSDANVPFPSDTYTTPVERPVMLAAFTDSVPVVPESANVNKVLRSVSAMRKEFPLPTVAV